MKQALCILALLLPASNLSAAVFQYAVPVTTRKGDRMAYLWIPPQAGQVRGVVMGGMTLMEREFAQDARIRKVCAEQGVTQREVVEAVLRSYVAQHRPLIR